MLNSNPKQIVGVCVCTLLLLSSGSVARAQILGSDHETVQFAEVADRAFAARNLTLFSPDTYIVEGTRVIDNPFVIARQVVFRPDSQLVFSNAAIEKVAYRKGIEAELYIIAETIVSEGESGRITWASYSSIPEPRSLEKATDGTSGRAHGEAGAAGREGLDGLIGVPGADAPSLNLFLVSLDGVLELDLVGGDGGPGGFGQEGGNGGNGQRGRPASSSAFDCKSGPGTGGNAGAGGDGGNGGDGGAGGRGGTIFVYAPAESSIELHTNVEGGAGGLGGEGGLGGQPGKAGPAGKDDPPWCRARSDRSGHPARPGRDGVPGNEGSSGEDGRILLVPTNEKQLFRIIGEDN